MRLLAAFLLTLSAATARPWTEDLMYFVLTDRFHDGDPANNIPPGSDPALYDPAQKEIRKYHGGDLRGLELAIRDGYFAELGVTALWITPPVRNVWRSGTDRGWSAGYHGYWAQDFLDIDPHLTSTTSLSGEAYPEGAEGRMRHYRDFVALAHAKGLKVIQDVVLNHAGPVFFYDVDGDGSFDEQEGREWSQPFKREGYHPNAVWAEVPRWNLHRTQPDGPRELLGQRIATSGVLSELGSYGRKGISSGSLGREEGGENIECDFHTLRDLWTAPESAHFSRLVDEFVEIHAFYLTEIGVDGLRLDTVKHVHHPFWDAFTERLRKRLGERAKDKLIFGEVYGSKPGLLGRYTWRSDWPARTDPSLDSVLDFAACEAVRAYLRPDSGGSGHAGKIEQAMKNLQSGEAEGRPIYNPNPGADGLNSREKSITFIENHDGLNRFRVQGVSARSNELAQALVLTLPGIPCLYYGAELGVQDESSRPGQDSESGRMTLFPRGKPPKANASESFRLVSRVAALRKEIPALRNGRFQPVWTDSPASPEDDGIFLFARAAKEGERVLVAFNASGRECQASLPTGFPGGTKLRGQPLCGSGGTPELVVSPDGRATLPIPAEGAMIFRPLHAKH